MTRALLAAALLAGCTTTAQHVAQSYPSGAVIIAGDMGGNAAAYIARAQQLRASGRPVVITDRCDSSCTIYASLPNACIAPGASLGLHPSRLVWTVSGQRFEAGPSPDSPYYDHVTPQIAARVRAMPFDWEQPWRIQDTITFTTAPAYGLRQC
jgi:hypothetical protein